MAENNSKDNNDIFTKEEFLKLITEFEDKWMKMLDMKQSHLERDISDIKSNSLDILQKSKILLDNYTSEKIKESKITELEAFKNKVNDMLITHEIRINNNIKDISNFSSKYEKVIQENLFVPGFVGPSCQYKSLSEYLTYNMNEVSKIRIDKETLKKEQTEFKAKIDGFIKQMIMLNESTMTRSREYTNGKQKDLELMVDGKIKPVNDKIFKFYESSLLFQENVKKEIKVFRNDLDIITKIKEELINLIKEKEEQFKNKLDEIYKKIVFNIQDIGINKNKISEIEKEIKGINKTYDNLNSSINNITKEITNIKNINVKKNNPKDIRRSVVHYNTFANKLDKSHLSSRIFNNDKTPILNKTEDFIEKEVKEEEEEKNNNNSDNSKENKDDNINKDNINQKNNGINEENNKVSDKENNDLKTIEEKLKSKLLNQENENTTAKNKYKSLYNKMMKENDDVIFETFCLGNTKIPIITKPFLLDQRILSDQEIARIYKERKEKKKQKEKTAKIRDNFYKQELNNKNGDINKGKNLDLINHKISTSKPILNKNSEEKMFNLTNYTKKRIKEINKDLKNRYLVSMERTQYKFITNKNNNINNLNLINLKLDDSAAINPDTNNGAYVLANKLLENNHISRIMPTPTSYFYIKDNSKGKKTSKLMSMNFIQEERKILNSLNNTIENENRLRLEINDLNKNV